MKTTVDLPDDLHRLVKAKSALEGRTVREVAIILFEGYVGVPVAAPVVSAPTGATPSWFGALRPHLTGSSTHDLDSIRESIGRALESA